MEAQVAIPHDTVLSLREASRRLVRGWGFLEPTVAGSVFTASASHCLLEIGDHNVNSFDSLREVLQICDDQLTRTLAELISQGAITAKPAAQGGRGPKDACYTITPSGSVTLAAINAYAQGQVEQALDTTSTEARSAIIGAFQQYAAALQKVRVASMPTPEDSPAPSPRPRSPLRAPVPQPVPGNDQAQRRVAILTGYRPGILGRTLEMHLNFYYSGYGWGAKFEASLGAGLSGLMPRLDRPLNEAWCAVETMPDGDERIVGTIFVDGEDLGIEGVAHIRAFIVDDSTRGLGLGRKLFDAAMQFILEKEFKECRLWTMKSLLLARRLYEGAGFVNAGEEYTEEFGPGIWSMQYCWRRGG